MKVDNDATHRPTHPHSLISRVFAIRLQNNVCYLKSLGNISENTQKMPQSRSTPLPRHQRRRDEEQIRITRTLNI